MGPIPAVCNNCGTIFPSPQGGGNVRMVMKNCRAGPCPQYGGYGTIPDGLYDFASKTLNLVKNANARPERVEEIIAILLGLKRDNADNEIVRNSINKNVPELSSLSSVLPRTRSELYAFLAAIVVILTFIITNFKSCSGISGNNVDKIVNNHAQSAWL